VSKIGWDELLKTRSSVFVMEEEYRAHKTNASIDVNGVAVDAASITGMRSPGAIPTIRISSESSRGKPNGGHSTKPSSSTIPETHEAESDSKEEMEAVPELTKPELTQARADPDSSLHPKPDDEELVSAFSNKRLCERWLDNLFL
jgi:hypothetical protein